MPVQESNLKYSIKPDGVYGGNTSKLMEALMGNTANAGVPEYSGQSLRDVGMNIGHHDNDFVEDTLLPNNTEIHSFRKLLQDYQPVENRPDTIDQEAQIALELENDFKKIPRLATAEHVYKIMTPELLRGRVLNAAESRTIAASIDQSAGEFTDEDLGLYEMFRSYDWDGDGLSNLAEVENSLNGDYSGGLFNPLSINNNTSTNYDERLLTAYNRGGWGVSLSQTNGIYTPIGSGLLMGEISGTDGQAITGLRIPTFTSGIYDLGGAQDKNKDSYTTLPVVQLLEAVGRQWAKDFPDTAPLETNPATHAASSANRAGQRRIGINDISSAAGGFNKASHLSILRQGRTITNYDLQHSTHHNGLDIDMRFVANKDVERKIDLNSDRSVFDVYATAILLSNIAAQAAQFGLVPRAMYAGENVTQLKDSELKILCSAIGLTSNCKNQTAHHHHIHLSFSNGNSNFIKAPDNATKDIEIAFLEGGDNTEDYFEVFYDMKGNALLPWHRISFTDSIKNSNDEEIIQVRSKHPITEQKTKLWVNDQNEVAHVGKVRLEITCLKADDTSHAVLLKNKSAKNTLIKTLNITCTSPTAPGS